MMAIDCVVGWLMILDEYLLNMSEKFISPWL